MEQSSYQHHSINLFAIFQETTYIFIYQILPISLIFLPVICVPCPRSYRIYFVNLYVLLLLLLLLPVVTCSAGSVEVHSRVEVLLELVEADMRDQGGLITSHSALRYLMSLISREFSLDNGRQGGTSTSQFCASIKSLRIIDPSMPSTGL